MRDKRCLSMKELEAGLDEVLLSPKDDGVLELIARRPQTGEREVLKRGILDPKEGLVGDNWISRGSSRTRDGSSHPDMQLNIMNSRVIALISQEKERWQLAGDQMYIDLDLSPENLPPGTRLVIGTSMIEVTSQPHTGCKKFVERFGLDAMKFISSKRGKQLNLRGINAKVIKHGIICKGDIVKKLDAKVGIADDSII